MIVAAPLEIQAVHDITYPFHQDAQFFWLTGIKASGWKLIIDGLKSKEYLIAPELDSHEIIFNGQQDWSEVKEQSGVAEVLTTEEATSLMKRLSHEYKEVYSPGSDPYDRYVSAVINPSYEINKQWIASYFETSIDCRADLNKLMAIKTEDQIQAMRGAINLTATAFEAAKKELANASYENEIEAEFDYVFRRNNTQHAYEPIVAAGQNALTLHYVDNNQKLPENGLVVIDIGCVNDGYAADITRTYAIGAPTSREAEVHAAVERAQRECIELIKPDFALVEYQKETDRIMKEALQGLGLLNSFDDDETYRKYFPHAVSHGLGIDVHESLGGYKELQPGMVLTVEPGIYIPEEGIGVRIEDDILVTATGYENLSAHLSTSL